MSSVSAIFGSKIPFTSSTIAPPPSQRLLLGGGNGGLTIECSSRPQKKATAHHMKTRPKKTNPADRRHGPAVYPPLPPLPAEWTLLAAADTFSEAAEADASSAELVEAE